MKDFLHLLSHVFGYAKGRVVTFWMDGELWAGFHCDKCDEIFSAHKCDFRKARK